MYEVTVTDHISASHHLRGYRGKCENVHGHNYRVEATASATALDERGLAIDFGDLRGRLRRVVERFDHRDLNALPAFADCNPSSENLARILFQQLAAELTDLDVRLDSIRVWETEGNFITYRPEADERV